MNKLASFLCSFVLWAGVAQAQSWVPPVGIPTPPVGITEVAPPPTLFVDEGSGSDSNPGTVVSPRKTIPQDIPPCTSIQIQGNYTRNHTSPNTLAAHGTPECPVWISGGNVTNHWEVSGTHLFIEKVKFGAGLIIVRDQRGGIPTHHIVIRDNEQVGNVTGGGMGVQSYDGARVSDIVFLRNYIHDVGDMNTTTDQDSLCIGIYRINVDHVWALENKWVQCASDGIQVNATNGPEWRSVHHIYIGRNYCYHNRQGCAWAKESADVVISENVCHGMRPDAPLLNMGHCYGAQYGSERLAIINNVAFDSENGIAFGSYNEGYGKGTIIAGNLIYNIHHTRTTDDINNAWSGGAAIRLSGGGTNCFSPEGNAFPCVLIFNNTFYDTDGGIQIPAGGATAFSFNNIFKGQRRAVVQLEAGGMLSLNDLVNVTNPPVPPFYEFLYEPDTLFVSPSTGDFRLNSTSVGFGKGYVVDLGPAWAPIHGVPGPTYGTNVGSDMTFTIPTPPATCNSFWLWLFGFRTPAGCIN